MGKEEKTREWKEDNTVLNELKEEESTDGKCEPLLSFISEISNLGFLSRTYDRQTDGQTDRQADMKKQISQSGTQTDSSIQREQTSLYAAKQQVLCHVSHPFINSPSHTRQYTLLSACWAN